MTPQTPPALPAAVPSGDLMTSAEASASLGVDRSTLSRWVALGKIRPALKSPGLRGAFHFDPREVDRTKAAGAAAAAADELETVGADR